MVFDILSDSLLKSRDHLKQCIRVDFEAEILLKGWEGALLSEGVPIRICDNQNTTWPEISLYATVTCVPLMKVS